jgi:hypothetical protein
MSRILIHGYCENYNSARRRIRRRRRERKVKRILRNEVRLLQSLDDDIRWESEINIGVL